MSPAPSEPRIGQVYLADRQREFPPWRGRDGIAPLYSILAPSLSAEIRALHDSGRLVIGEVGTNGVHAHIENLGNREWVIEIYSGLVEFLYTVTRTLSGASSHHSSGEIQKPTLTIDELIPRVAGVFQAWQRGDYQQRFSHPRFLAQPDALKLAHEIALSAETFFVAHEIGHVALELATEGSDSPALSPTDIEAFADRFAVRTVLNAALSSGQVRMPYAGALFAIRVFNFLEKMGAKMHGPHPPPHARLELIREEARAVLGGARRLASISTIALAMDEFMEMTENVLNQRGKDTEDTVEKIQVGLWAVLEEAARPRIKMNRAVQDFAARIKDVPAVILTPAVENICEWLFRPWQEQSGAAPLNELEVKMTAKLVEIIDALPDAAARTIFLRARYYPQPRNSHGQ